MEEEREEHAGQHEHDEAVEGDLSEHERPVVGEHLVERLARESCAAQAVVEPANEAVQHDGAASKWTSGGRGERPGLACSSRLSQRTKRKTPPTTAARPP